MVLINSDKCIGCRICIPYCTTNAIRFNPELKKVIIDKELCVECNTCVRVVPCPMDAIEPSLSESRKLRNFFSDPISVHTTTGIPGRGTEEMKTNDVTGRFRKWEIGFVIDIGRPHLGLTLKELSKFIKVLNEVGVIYEKNNPILYLMEDMESGKIKDDVKDERVLSVVLEFKVPLEKVKTVIEKLKYLAKITNTVFSVGLISRVESDGTIPVINILKEVGVNISPIAKVNVGLGKPLFMD
ncbi:MAG: 4Fe-4S binding protein [Candidatus Methanomethylicaceae archaeon]